MPAGKVIVLNIIYRSDNGKVSLTVENVNDNSDALNIDVMDKRNIGGNCLNNSGLHLKSTGYSKLAINFGPSTVFVVAQTTTITLLIKSLRSIKKKLPVISMIGTSLLRITSQAMI